MTKITAKFRNGLWTITWTRIGSELRALPRTFRSAAELQAWADANLAPHIIREV